MPASRTQVEGILSCQLGLLSSAPASCTVMGAASIRKRHAQRGRRLPVGTSRSAAGRGSNEGLNSRTWRLAAAGHTKAALTFRKSGHAVPL